jgi:hypothetical protein
MYNHFTLSFHVLCLKCSTNQKRDHLLEGVGAVRQTEEEEDEDVPSAMHYSINDDATNDLAFRVGPVMDGHISDPFSSFYIPITPNYYQPLADEDNTIYMCMNTILYSSELTPETTPERQVKRIQHSPFQHLTIQGTPDSTPSPKQKKHSWFPLVSE